MELHYTVSLFALFSTFQNAVGLPCPTLFEYYPDRHDCSRFYRCVWGHTEPFSCPSGTLWEQTLLMCDHAEKVTCHATSSNSWVDRLAHVGELKADTPDFNYAGSSPWKDHVAFSNDDNDNSGRYSEKASSDKNGLSSTDNRNYDTDFYQHYIDLGQHESPSDFGGSFKLKSGTSKIPYTYNGFYSGYYHRGKPKSQNSTEVKVNPSPQSIDADLHRYQLFDSELRSWQEKQSRLDHQNRRTQTDHEKEQEIPPESGWELEWSLGTKSKRNPNKQGTHLEQESKNSHHEHLGDESKELERIKNHQEELELHWHGLIGHSDHTFTLEDLEQLLLETEKSYGYEKDRETNNPEEEQEKEQIRKHHEQLQQHKRELEDHLEQVLALEELQRRLSEEIRPPEFQEKWTERELVEQKRMKEYQQELEEKKRIQKHQEEQEQYQQELKQHGDQVRALESLQKRQELENRLQQQQQQQQQQQHEKQDQEEDLQHKKEKQKNKNHRSYHQNNERVEKALTKSQKHASELQEHHHQVQMLKRLQKQYQEFKRQQKQKKKKKKTYQQRKNLQTELNPYQQRLQEHFNLLHDLRDHYSFTPYRSQTLHELPYQDQYSQRHYLQPHRNQFMRKIRTHPSSEPEDAEKSPFSAAMNQTNQFVVKEEGEEDGQPLEIENGTKQPQIAENQGQDRQQLEDRNEDENNNNDDGEQIAKVKQDQQINNLTNQEKNKQEGHPAEKGAQTQQHRDNEQKNYVEQKVNHHNDLEEKEEKQESKPNAHAAIEAILPKAPNNTQSVQKDSPFQSHLRRQNSYVTGHSQRPQQRRQNLKHDQYPETNSVGPMRGSNKGNKGTQHRALRDRLRKKPPKQRSHQRNPSQSRPRSRHFLNQSNLPTQATEKPNASINHDLLFALLMSNSEEFRGLQEEYTHSVDTPDKKVIGSVIGRETSVVEESIPWLMSDFFRAGYGYKRIYP